MSRYFSLKEMLATSTGLDNFPTWGAVENLKLLCWKLDLIREKFGKAILVTSGYRSAAVNNAVGGSRTSAHQVGLAADIKAYSGKESETRRLYNTILTMGIDFDQLILYTSNGKAEGIVKWVHFGLSSAKNRCEILVKQG